MKKGQKPNANEKQLRAATSRGMDRTMVFVLNTLGDKFGFDRNKLIEFIAAVANLADGVNKGYVKYDQLHRVLVEEQGLEW